MAGKQCDAHHAGIGGCPSPVTWVIKAADMQMNACSRHLNRVCLMMRQKGAEYMTLSARDQ